MSEAETDCIRREVHAYLPEDFEFRAPFWFLKKEPGQPLCPKSVAKQSVVRWGKRE